ncbi:MAG: cytochrome c [Ghiorsea sp.]|nr:cytochrome c [Ghiorsea sp.]
MKKIIMTMMVTGLLASQAQAADTFKEGKDLFQQNCFMCHNAELEPAQAPPMFGVQMKYKMATEDKESFVNRITDFVMHPTKEKTLLKEPVKVLGVMPDIGAEEDEVRKIAAYIHDETFQPPCSHWKHAAERFKKEGKMQMYKSINKGMMQCVLTLRQHQKCNMPTLKVGLQLKREVCKL